MFYKYSLNVYRHEIIFEFYKKQYTKILLNILDYFNNFFFVKYC